MNSLPEELNGYPLLTFTQLERAVADELVTYEEEWEAELDKLETESADLVVFVFLQVVGKIFLLGTILSIISSSAGFLKSSFIVLMVQYGWLGSYPL